MLLLGAAAWALRCLLFAIGSDRSLVAIYARSLMHGVVYGCIYVAGQLMVHDRAPSQMQFAAQGFMALATMGIGNLAGAWIAGYSRHLYVECRAARLARDLAGGRRRLERGDDRYPVVLANQ